MLDDNLLYNARDYLDNKYEIITNIRNSRKEELMDPCRLSENEIAEHHYSRIKKVVID
jgi:hypothetical protein